MKEFEGERRNIQEVNTTRNESISSTVSILVPAVCGTDIDLGEHLLNLVDLFQKLRAGEVTAIEGFGANSDSTNNVLVSGDSLLQGIGIGLERFWDIGPRKRKQKILANVKRNRFFYAWKPEETYLPDSENELEVLLLGSWNDSECVVTVVGSVGSDDIGMGLEDVEVLFEIGLVLASTVTVLDTQRESKLASGRDTSRQG